MAAYPKQMPDKAIAYFNDYYAVLEKGGVDPELIAVVKKIGELAMKNYHWFYQAAIAPSSNYKKIKFDPYGIHEVIVAVHKYITSSRSRCMKKNPYDLFYKCTSETIDCCWDPSEHGNIPYLYSIIYAEFIINNVNYNDVEDLYDIDSIDEWMDDWEYMVDSSTDEYVSVENRPSLHVLFTNTTMEILRFAFDFEAAPWVIDDRSLYWRDESIIKPDPASWTFMYDFIMRVSKDYPDWYCYELRDYIGFPNYRYHGKGVCDYLPQDLRLPYEQKEYVYRTIAILLGYFNIDKEGLEDYKTNDRSMNHDCACMSDQQPYRVGCYGTCNHQKAMTLVIKYIRDSMLAEQANAAKSKPKPWLLLTQEEHECLTNADALVDAHARVVDAAETIKKGWHAARYDTDMALTRKFVNTHFQEMSLDMDEMKE
jgi:hypothetical protein